MAFGAPGVIGLDIGTSAVRAALLGNGRGKRSLLRFGQVALPPGAVSGGEIRDPSAVSEAISQLWNRTKFKSKKAVLGLANQRVVVRQIDIPFMEEKELRESLKFQVSEHIPMSVDDAELDFQVLEDFMTDDNQHMLRILIVAAASDMVESFISVASEAGIHPEAVDITPFAVARAVSEVARGEHGVAGAEAVVDVGAGITNIVIHHNGEARFVRILQVGGDDATGALAEELGVEFEEAEAMKYDLGGGVGTESANEVLNARVDGLVREIQGSIDYYMSQDDSEPVTSVVVTGGGSQTPGFIERLEAAVGLRVHTGSTLSDVDVSKSGLTEEQLAQVEPVAAAAVGLAMGALK
ncbi:MAG: type IV pilus assembly protein PilM [Actinomycetota bacterium]